MNTPKLFVAAKALLRNKDKILVIREASTYKEGTQLGKFDVPGGRIEPGQSVEESLKREIEEETGIKSVTIRNPIHVNEVCPVIHEEPLQIIRIFFECSTEEEKITLSADHDAFKWISPEAYLKENLIENLYPVFEAYLSFFKAR